MDNRQPKKTKIKRRQREAKMETCMLPKRNKEIAQKIAPLLDFPVPVLVLVQSRSFSFLSFL